MVDREADYSGHGGRLWWTWRKKMVDIEEEYGGQGSRLW